MPGTEAEEREKQADKGENAGDKVPVPAPFRRPVFGHFPADIAAIIGPRIVVLRHNFGLTRGVRFYIVIIP